MKRRFLPARRIGSVLLLCAVILGCAGCQPSSGVGPAVTQRAQTPQPTETPEPAAETPEPAAETRPPEEDEQPEKNGGEEQDTKTVTYAAGYVRVSSPTVSGWLPLPEKEDYVFPLRQMTAEGDEIINNIHLTPTGVYMESATCENQDCVKQGEVTLENKSARVLENMIICLPNQVFLELYSSEELLAGSGEADGASQ